MPTVFVPQVPSRFDIGTDSWMPKLDLSPAAKFGKIEILLPPEANRLLVVPLFEMIKEKLAEFSAQDWIVAVGDPTIFAATACYATRKAGGILRLLKWDRKTGDYIPVEIRI